MHIGEKAAGSEDPIDAAALGDALPACKGEPGDDRWDGDACERLGVDTGVDPSGQLLVEQGVGPFGELRNRLRELDEALQQLSLSSGGGLCQSTTSEAEQQGVQGHDGEEDESEAVDHESAMAMSGLYPESGDEDMNGLYPRTGLYPGSVKDPRIGLYPESAGLYPGSVKNPRIGLYPESVKSQKQVKWEDLEDSASDASDHQLCDELPEIPDFHSSIFGDSGQTLADAASHTAISSASPLLVKLVRLGMALNCVGGICGLKVESLAAEGKEDFPLAILKEIEDDSILDSDQKLELVAELCVRIELMYEG